MKNPQHACHWCGRKFRLFQIHPVIAYGGERYVRARSRSIHSLDPEGRFCKLRCAASYGVRAARGEH